MALLVALATPQTTFVRHADIPYAQGPRGGLDVCEPRAPHPGAPVVVFFYGGNWQGGDKALYRFVGAALAASGVVTVIPDYRVYPQVRFPGFLDDNARAVRWTKDHAADYGADPGKLFLMGHSAGAYGAAMLALERRWLGAVGLDPRRDVRGVIGLSGPYDFLPLKSETLKIIFGPPERLPDTQPINHVDGRGPPFLLMAGETDKTVLPRNSLRLAARIKAEGGRSEAVIFPKTGHARTVTDMLPLIGGAPSVRARILQFIAARLAGAPARAAA